ncbi:MAG TPA: UvrD-helicase domain-containing protein [Cellvibrionaceae bacterium]
MSVSSDTDRAYSGAKALPPDAAARRRALTPEQSFIVEAPAGSGKTELLTQRILTLLARVNQPEAIVAITFTRKAAAEMHARLVQALKAACAPAPSNSHQAFTWQLARQVLEQDAKQGWQLLQNPGRLRISTFDSLCASLTQALPLQAKLGHQLNITDDPERLYKAAIDDLYASLAQAQEPLSAPLASLVTLLTHLDNRAERLASLFQGILARRDAWRPLLRELRSFPDEQRRKVLESHLAQRCDEHFELLANYLLPLWPQLRKIAFAAALRLQDNPKGAAIARLNSIDQYVEPPQRGDEARIIWLGLKQLFLTNSGTFRIKLDVNCGFPAGTNKAEKEQAKADKTAMKDIIWELAACPGVQEALAATEYLPSRHYSQEQWAVLSAVLDVLPRLLAHLRLVFARTGQLDFTEVALSAEQALGDDDEPTDLALRLDYQIQHLLIDEFQDTSPTQGELLRRLTYGWTPGDGRSLFCVGDAMQSIYSFRAADVSLFLHVKAHGLGDLTLELLQLTANFRSAPSIVSWVNRIFTKAFPEVNDIASGAVAYSPAEAFRPEQDAQVHYLSIAAGQGPDLEAQLLLDQIIAHRINSPDDSIAILVRNRAYGQYFLTLAQAAGLEPMAVDMQALAQYPAVEDAWVLTQALLNPADLIAWLSILRGPWVGLTLAQLHLLRSQPGSTVLEQIPYCLATGELEPVAQTRLSRAWQVLGLAWQERARKPLRWWVEATWLALGGIACVAKPDDLNNLERYWQCLEASCAQGEAPSLSRIQTALAKLFAAPSAHADTRLQIMTIHKSKGLEFDAVFLPSLHKSRRPADKQLWLWQRHVNQEGEANLLVSALGAATATTDPIYKHLEKAQSHREALEQVRLTYVACTRAKRHLYLFAEVKPGQEPGQNQAPPKGSALGSLWPALETLWPVAPQAIEDPSVVSSDIAAQELAPLNRLAADWTLPAWPHEHLLAAYIPPYEYQNQAQSPFDPACDAPRAIGTLVHQALSGMAEHGMRQWQKHWPGQHPAWSQQLIRIGLPHDLIPTVITAAQALIKKALNDPFLQLWLNQPERCQAETTWMHSAADGKSFLTVRPDLLWHSPEGETWLIDYKTAEPTVGIAMEEFVDNEKSIYRPIMARYCQALQAAGIKHLRVGLYFVGLGVWAEYADIAEGYCSTNEPQ